MQFCRMYTGADGKSHFEELDQTQGGKFFLSTLAAKALVFKNDDNRDILGWQTHRAANGASLSPERSTSASATARKNLRPRRCFSRRRCHRPGSYRTAEELGAGVHSYLVIAWFGNRLERATLQRMTIRDPRWNFNPQGNSGILING